MRKTVLVCIDGLDPEILAAVPTPNLDAAARSGFRREVAAVMPSVTNVNQVSIVTGSFPSQHGVVSNYWFDPAQGTGRHIETAEFLTHTTVFQRAAVRGLRSGLVVTKDKLRRLLGAGADAVVSAESPAPEWARAVGPAQPVYSSAVDIWALRALRRMLRVHDPDLAYCTTTDYMMHTYEPGAPEMRAHIQSLDRELGELLAEFPGHQFLLTADHGMRTKTLALDLQAVLTSAGISCHFVPVIKDRYVRHHSNQGGFGFIYLARPGDEPRAARVLAATGGVEEVMGRAAAAAQFHLPPDRLGDLVVLGDEHTLFAEAGSLGAPQALIRLRSHGSRHEARVPLVAYNCPLQPETFTYNLDIVRRLGI